MGSSARPSLPEAQQRRGWDGGEEQTPSRAGAPDKMRALGLNWLWLNYISIRSPWQSVTGGSTIPAALPPNTSSVPSNAYREITGLQSGVSQAEGKRKHK